MVVPTGNGTASIFLSDYGGVCRFGEDAVIVCMGTYPPPEAFNGWFTAPATKASARAIARYMAAVLYVDAISIWQKNRMHDDRLYANTVSKVQHNSTASQEDRVAAICRMKAVIRLVPDPRAARLASWLSENPADRA